MMGSELASYSGKEFRDALALILDDIMAPCVVYPAEEPKAMLLGGQSGAGKTTLHHLLLKELSGNVAIVNGDAYRGYHPRFHELQEAYGDEAVAYTAEWAGKMTEALVDRLSRLGYNLIIEGTLRTSEVPLATASLLRGRGYDISLALMAVKPEISLVSCQLRYEQMRLAGTVPRATDLAHHRKIVDQIVENLEVLEGSDTFDDIALYSRAEERLYPVEGDDRSAAEALNEVLFGPWSDEEKAHLAYLEERLAELRSL